MSSDAPATAHPAPRRHRAGTAALWFGLFGGPAAWSVQELVNTPVVGHACYPAVERLAQPTIGGLPALPLVVSIATALVAAAALWTAAAAWRSVRRGHPGEHGTLLEIGEGRTRFMALSGILLACVFLFGIVMHAIPILFLPPCS